MGILTRFLRRRTQVSQSWWARLLWDTTGAQMLEAALSFPIVVVMSVGISNFSGAYRLKHHLNNAVREGARFATAQSTLDLDCGGCSAVPESVTAVRDVVANYLTNANVTFCAIGTIPAYSSNFRTWTYSSASNGCSAFSLVIQRGYPVLQAKTNILSTHVSLAYPYEWAFNVNGLLNLVDRHNGSTLGTDTGDRLKQQPVSLPSSLSSDAIMENLP
jgi:Flp pilus assembly protein TadG